jgi:DNA-binding NarL/FixJ family response regulator
VEAAWAEGGALSPAVAVAEALADLDGRGTDDEPRTAPGILSARELDVMRLLVTGKTDREIAGALFISRRTAQGHVANIFTKLGVSTRTAAATVALQTKLLEDPVDQV